MGVGGGVYLAQCVGWRGGRGLVSGWSPFAVSTYDIPYPSMHASSCPFPAARSNLLIPKDILAE